MTNGQNRAGYDCMADYARVCADRNQLAADNRELMEVVRHLADILPYDRWADDARKLARATLDKIKAREDQC